MRELRPASPRVQTGIDPVSLIFLSVGGVLLAVCVFLAVRTSGFRSRAAPATGTVVELRYESGRKGGAYFPVVRFQTRDGQEVRFKNGVGQNPAAHKVGDSVEVLYEPARPQRASINHLFDLYFSSLITGFMGLMFTGFGVAIPRWGHGGKLKGPTRRPGTP